MERLTKRITEATIELSAKANPFQYNGSPQRVQPKHPFWNVFDRLCKYEDAEEQGLLKTLPCRVGDTVYVATKTLNKRRGFYGEKQIIFETEPIPEYVECKVVGISFKNKGNFIKVRYTGAFEEKVFDDETGYDYLIITDSVDKNYAFSSVGKTVFLTEAALAEKGGV